MQQRSTPHPSLRGIDAVRSATMFVRHGVFEVILGKHDELRETYNRDCVPIVRAASGNIDVYLLEPVDGAGPIIASTIWETEEHARAYEARGTA